MPSRVLTLPSKRDIEIAQSSQHELTTLLKKTEIRKICLIDDNKKSDEIVVPAYVIKLLAEMLTEVARGNAIKVAKVPAELTIHQAADLLNVSQSHVIKLLEDTKEITYYKIGRHRRIKLADLMEYKKKRDEQCVDTAGKLTSQAQELDLGY